MSLYSRADSRLSSNPLQCDQDKQGTCADTTLIEEFVNENNFVGWFETSAKDNTNIDESARALVAQVRGIDGRDEE